MRKVFMATDGTLYKKAKYCRQYERFLRRAQATISGLGMRGDDEPITGEIKQLDLPRVLAAWREFVNIIIQLVEWSGELQYYIPYSGASPMNVQERTITLLNKYRDNNENILPIAVKDKWAGISYIYRKFEAVNFDNGEEYCGSFGVNKDREGFLRLFD